MAPDNETAYELLHFLIKNFEQFSHSTVNLKASLENIPKPQDYDGDALLFSHQNAAVLRVALEGGLTLWYGILYDFDKRLEGSGVLSEEGVRCAFLGPGIRHDQSTDGTYSVTRAENGDITKVEFKATGTRDHSTMDMRAERIRSK